MKKFILCVVVGYALIFTLFIGLPQMMGGRGETLVPKGGGATVATASILQNKSGAKSQKSALIAEQPQTSPLTQDHKNPKPYETGPVETFYRNGTLSSEWILDQAGGGIFKTYTPEGRPWMTIPFVHNVIEGELKSFYPEGPLFSKENYLAGEKAGASFWQYKNGNPWLEISWISSGTGVLVALYSEDTKRADLPSVQAEQSTGYFKAFDEHGHEVINVQQAGGEQHIVLKSYYQSGSLSAEIGLKGKRLHGRTARYYPDGKLWMETEFSEEGRAQNTTVYLPGEVVSSTEMLLTEPQVGLEWKTYYPDARIFWQMTKLESPKQSPIYQLTTHWQDQTSAEAKKERILL